jgi:alpha-glucosidase
MNYYFIYGPQMQDVVTTYTDLTGKPELPPLWAWLPSMQVELLSESIFRLLRLNLEHKIPCDALYLDIDYMDGFRCFTWNKDLFQGWLN